MFALAGNRAPASVLAITGVSCRRYGIFKNMTARLDHAAVIDSDGTHTYGSLLSRALKLKDVLQATIGTAGTNLDQPRIAYLAPRRHTYVAAKLSTWLHGGVGVPLAEGYPPAELEYVLTDSGASAILVDPTLKSQVESVAAKLGLPVIDLAPEHGTGNAPADKATISERIRAAVAGRSENDGAYFVYTSGTTGKPKGVVTTHEGLAAQMHALCTAWEWSRDDAIVHVLPLHHVHGILAVLLCGLNSGATVTLLRKFDAQAVWLALVGTPAALAPTSGSAPVRVPKPTLFMAVPTVYAKLLQHFHEQTPEIRAAWTAALAQGGASAIRLMVSGSAALPEPVAADWRAVTGHALLERYGMTETGMALSNPLHGERRLNAVGFVMPGYEARIADETSADGSGPDRPVGEAGQLLVRGPGVFRGYWNRPDATAESFTSDGWYKTGDLCVVDTDGYFHILGRMSADIMKSGGYKISALEIERVLLDCPAVKEIAVFGVADAVWGERVVALVVPSVSAPTAAAGGGGAAGGSSSKAASAEPASAGTWTEDAQSLALRQEIKRWAGSKLAPYKLPSVVRVLATPELPRNAMGKVNKKALRAEYFGVPK